MANPLDNYVAALPELYQRVYGHPEYDRSSRPCDDRARVLTELITSLQDTLGKKALRVLDIGCAQGYYALTLAALGCIVVGVDVNAQNVALCRYLASEQNLGATFVQANVTKEYIASLEGEQFDVVLALSVLHHLTHAHGFEYVFELLRMLSFRCTVMIAELARKEEPLYWNVKLPDDYRAFLEPFSFAYDVAWFPTHLSDIKRPLCVASNHIAFCNRKAYRFDTVLTKPFSDAPVVNARTSYLGDGVLVKLVKKDTAGMIPILVEETRRAAGILREYQDTISFFPRLVDLEETEHYLVEVVAIKRGELLYDMVAQGRAIDYTRVILDVLDNLIELEQHGLYHTDLRLWNVVVDEKSARLIDFGAIIKRGDTWVFDQLDVVLSFKSFAALVYDLVRGKLYRDAAGSGTFALDRDFTDAPEPYRTFLTVVLKLGQGPSTYQQLREEAKKLLECQKKE